MQSISRDFFFAVHLVRITTEPLQRLSDTYRLTGNGTEKI